MLFSVLTVLFFTGCSTTLTSFFEGSDSVQDRNEKLVAEDFTDEKEVFDKFKEVKNEKEEMTPEKKIIKEEVAKKRQGIRPVKLNRKLIKKSKKEKIIQSKNTQDGSHTSVKRNDNTTKSEYPEEYPEELKDHDMNSEPFWGRFSPFLFPGEEIVLNITYLGVNTGEIAISTKKDTQLGEENAFHVNARVKTARFYSYLYEIDDYCDSYIKKENFTPLKFSLIQRQSSQNIDDLQLFDHKEFKAYSFYKRVTKEKTKKKKIVEAIPKYFQDPLSIVYFIRGLPMDPEFKYTIPIINQGKVEVLNAQFEKTEVINTKIGKRKAYKVNIDTKHEGETIKGGSMTFWYSADEKRIFLKFEAKIKIGSISGEIESYKN